MWLYYRLIKNFIKSKRSQENWWFWIIGAVIILITLVVIIIIAGKSGKIGAEQLGVLE